MPEQLEGKRGEAVIESNHLELASFDTSHDLNGDPVIAEYSHAR